MKIVRFLALGLALFALAPTPAAVLVSGVAQAKFRSVPSVRPSAPRVTPSRPAPQAQQRAPAPATPAAPAAPSPGTGISPAWYLVFWMALFGGGSDVVAGEPALPETVEDVVAPVEESRDLVR